MMNVWSIGQSLKAGFRAFRSPRKAINFAELGTYLLGMTGENADITRNKAGAAAAFCYVPEVNNCISSIVGGIESLPWDIKRYPQGKRRANGKRTEAQILASDDDLQTAHPLQAAFRRFHGRNNFSLLSTMALDYTLYGEVFLEIARNEYWSNELIEWLNPLGVQVLTNRRIEYFRYGWSNTFITYGADEVAYLHNRNPQDDFTGYPSVLAAMDKVNITRNLDRFLRDYFINNARPGLVVMPPTPELDMSDADHTRILNQFRESLKGNGNQYNTFVAQKAVNVIPLDQPDLGKNSQLSEFQINAIYEKFGVPRAMRGNTSATPYKDGDETTRRFYLDAILPLAKTLQQFINTEIMPYFDQSNGLEVFEFDTSAFDLVTPADQLEEQIVNAQVQGGYLSLAEAARIQERTVEGWMENRYMIQGLPMRPDQIDALVQARIAAEQAATQPQQLFSRPIPPEVPESNLQRLLPEPKKAVAVHDHPAFWQEKLYADDPDEATIQARIESELKTYRSFELRHYGKSHRAFVPDVLPPYMHHVLIDALDTATDQDAIDKAFVGIWEHPRVKSITSYQRNLRELGTGLWRNIIDPERFTTGVQDAISREYEQAFYTGVKRGGLTKEDLTTDEYGQLVTLIQDERDYVPGLASWILNAKREGETLATVRGRLDQWVSRYASVENVGYIIASRDKKLKWVYDPRKEHCTDCQRLHGRIYRARIWRKVNIYPRSAQLACFGVWCGCEYTETDEPVTRGRPPNLVGSKQADLWWMDETGESA